jgi:hypothetical protein
MNKVVSVLILGNLLGVPLVANNEQVRKSEDFIRPVVFSTVGIKDFFLERFNDTFYVENFLPVCFEHVTDFLHFGLLSKDPRSTALMTLDIFHQRIKECRWVNPFALSLLLKSLPSLLGSLCADDTEAQKLRVKGLIYEAIRYRFDLLKDDPESFMNNLADTIVEDLANPNTTTAQDIQNMMIRFLESTLDKIIWDARDQEYVWESVKLIARQLEILFEHNIIAHEKDLNHLYWSLISRFCYFIELSGNQLSLTCCRTIREDVELCASRAPFLLKEEFEEYSIKKVDRLMEIILPHIAQKMYDEPEAVQQPVANVHDF